MLESVKISRRQSEIRQSLSELVGKPELSEDETRSMEALDKEYRSNEVRYRGALITEDEERREASADLETRSDKEYADLIGKFELRQVALHLDEGASITGPTAEVVQELRSQGGYRGVPIPYEALEIRAGETVASGTPSPTMTAPIIDRIFAASVAGRMGARFINIAQGTNDYPITSSSVSAGWAATETGAVSGPTAYSTANRSLAPDHTFGITMKVTRKALKQSGDALEQAIRRDMQGCMAEGLDAAVFQGTGSSGQPSGILVGSYDITSTAVSAAATWAAFRAAVVRFMTANAVSSANDVRLLIRPEVFDYMDDSLLTNTAVSEWDRLTKNISNPVMSANALAAPTGTPKASKALLTATVSGTAPIFVGTWGGIDLIRDPYSDAASGGLRLTGLVTADVTASRAAQLQILTGVQSEDAA
jgi:HK97 family phage major capsid protein